MTRRGGVRVGCSGWQYAAWRTAFYPTHLPVDDWLPYYAGRFDTVEVNNSFYRLPEVETFARWASRTPEGFLFSIKASRYLTHHKRLRDPEEPVMRLFERLVPMADRLGPVLFQLPASFQPDVARLSDLLAVLPRALGEISPGVVVPNHRIRHVVEFRDPRWYRDDVFAALEREGVAVCVHDKAGSRWEGSHVGPFVYIRFHGTSGHYKGSYSRRRLAVWAERIQGWSAEGRDVFAYFNNDPGASAPRNAQVLLRLLATPSF